jgi:DNA polymerase III subunit epsilon
VVKFSYSRDGRVLGIIDLFQAFQQPSRPITTEIVELTGITDTMVEGHTIDAGALESFLSRMPMS